MKRYVRAMSLERKRAEKQISSYASIIMEHIIKLIMYSDIRPEDISGWEKSVAKWIQKADDITVKPDAKKLEPETIMRTLFSSMGDEIGDYDRELYKFLADNHNGKFNHDGKGNYPEFEVTEDASETLMNVCDDIVDATMPLLIDKADHSLSEYIEVIKPIFDRLQ